MRTQDAMKKRHMQLWEAYLILNNPKTAYTKEEFEEAKRLVRVESVESEDKKCIKAD